MKHLPPFLILLLIFFPTGAQKPQLAGQVFELNSGKAKISGVAMWAEKSAANRVITKNDGTFTLTFQDMHVGDDVYLRADKTGWAVVNEMEMGTRIPMNPYEKPMGVVMCPVIKLDSIRSRYYNVTNQYIIQGYEKRMAQIDRKKRGWQNEAKTLNAQMKALQEKINTIVEGYVRMNMDDLSEPEKKALRLFLDGKIEEAIAVRENMDSKEQVQAALRRRRELDSALAMHTRNMIRLASEYMITFNFEKAEQTFQKLVNTDTTNVTNIFTLVAFLQTQNQYDKAIKWNQVALRHTGEQEQYNIDIENDLGALYFLKNDYNAAEQMWLHAYGRCSAMAGKFSFFEPKLAAIQMNLAILYQQTLEHDKWEQNILSAVQKWRHLTDSNKSFSADLARAYINLGSFYKLSQKYREARLALDSGLNILEYLDKERPMVFLGDLAKVYNNFGFFYMEQGQPADAERSFQKSVDALRQLAGKNPDAYMPDLASALLNRGMFFQTKKEYDHAGKNYQEALDKYGLLAKNNPAVFQPYLARCKMAIGDFHKDLKNYAAAENSYSDARILLDSAAGTPDVHLALWYNNMGILYTEQKKFLQAEKAFDTAEMMFKHLVKTDSVQFLDKLPVLYLNQSGLYVGLNKNRVAIKKLEQAKKIWKKLVLDNPDKYEHYTGAVAVNLSVVYSSENRFGEAETESLEAIAVYEKLLSLGQRMYEYEYLSALNGYVGILIKNKELDKAEKMLSGIIENWRRLAGITPEKYNHALAGALHNYGLVLWEHRRFKAAKNAFAESVRIIKPLAGAAPDAFEPELGVLYLLLAEAQTRDLDLLGAENSARYAVKIFRRLVKKEPKLYAPQFCSAVLLLCGFYDFMMQAERATTRKALFEEAKTVYDQMPESSDKQKLAIAFSLSGLENGGGKIRELEKAIDTTTENKQKIILQNQLIDARNELLSKGAPGQEVELGRDYGHLSWYLIMDRQYANAEKAARKALFPVTAEGMMQEYEKELQWVYTNLAVSLLLQNRFGEAEDIYIRFKDKPLQYTTFKTFFLSDLDKLEQAGITHKNFARVRKLLQ